MNQPLNALRHHVTGAIERGEKSAIVEKSAARLETLESIIDADGLAATLETLAEICHGKADHLRANWQDSASARVWESAARRVETAAAKIDV